MTTAQEALIAELLGDVGKLHDQIKELPDALSNSLAPTLEELSQVSKKAKTTYEHYEKSTKKLILSDGIKNALKKEASDALSKAAENLVGSIEQQHRGSPPPQRQQLLLSTATICVSIIVGLGTGILGFLGSHYLYSELQSEENNMGRAVISVWHELDESSQAKIIQAKNK